MMSGGEREQLFYHPACFRVLGEWLALAAERADEEGSSLRLRAAGISPVLAEYLDLNRCAEVWDRLRKNNPARPAFLKAFHGWFDGLKTMKLIHHLSDTLYPRCEPEEALAELFVRSGLTPSDSPEQCLEALRRLQNGSESSCL
jgi:hypothetical protein